MIRTVLAFVMMMSGCLFAKQHNKKGSENLIFTINYNASDSILAVIKRGESVLKVAEEVHDLSGIVLACNRLGVLYGTGVADFEKGIYYHERAASLARDLHDKKLVANNYLAAGILYHRLGLYGKGLEQLLASLAIYTAEKDVLNASIAKVNIAAIYSLQGVGYYAKAKAGFSGVIKTATILKNDSLLIMTICYYTTALIARGYFDEAEKYLNSALKRAKSSVNYVHFTPVLYANLGDLFFHDGMLKAAINYFETAQEQSLKNNDRPIQALTSLKLGQVYFQMGEVELAKQYYLAALQAFKNLKMNASVVDVYGAMAALEYNQRNYKEASRYSSIQSNLIIGLYTAQSKLLFETHTRALKGKITIEQKNEGINWLALSLIFLVLLLSCFMVLFYLNHQRLKSSKTRSMLVNENLILEKELQNQRLHEERLLQQLEFNAKTLTTNTLHIIQKNEILLQIKEKAEILRTSFPENLLPIKVKDLLHLVNFGLNIDKDWDNFKIHFEQVHTDFFDQLKTKYPNLNSSDLKLCALLKLNLDTKEIAAIMNISPQSVKVARSRLRKKLELNLTSNLSSFITQIQ